ncbi:MAG: aromatic ring-hydroxylating dioxygenase subunit alpha [Novosphingobium sp.]
MSNSLRPITDQPVVIDTEAYFSEAYARAENEKLWGEVWQVACREEEIAQVGDYVTFDILDESIIVVRTGSDRIAAYYNVCQHRGRRLTEGCGHARKFVCRFHGWQWNIDGENVHVLDPEDWEDTLAPSNLRMKHVSVDTWGGYVFINMNSDCGPLHDYLGVIPAMLDPFEINKMRYRWRQWLYFPCNWKVAIEAFIEGYHVLGTHPQLTKHSHAKTWSKAYGRHSVMGAVTTKGSSGGGTAGTSAAKDMRTALPEVLDQLWEEVNASTTETIVKAARRLKDELPADTPSAQVQMHLMRRAREDDAARGVDWPTVDPQHLGESGNDWHIFPNSVILHGPTFVLGYRARPAGYDPGRCIFEVYVLERFPEGQEPRPENVYTPQEDRAAWRKVLGQDFSNMAEVHRGMKSRGFVGSRPNPVQERSITNFHLNLGSYMDLGKIVPVA